MEFRKGGDRQDFTDEIAVRLRHIVCDAEDYIAYKHHKFITITSVYRSDEEQKAICKKLKIPYSYSVHTDLRGVDFIISDASQDVYLNVCEHINLKYPYDIKRPKYKTFLYHMGTGLHIHAQVKPGTL